MKIKPYVGEKRLRLHKAGLHMGGEWMDKELEVMLNPVTNGDIGTLNFVINCIRQVESVLDVKKKRHREQEKVHKTRSCNNRSSS